MSFVFYAYGHPAVVSTHPTTLEITKVGALTRRGDCIVAVKSSMGLNNLPPTLKKHLSTPTGRARLVLRVGSLHFSVEGRGAGGLTFSHPTDLVVRKSGFVSNRTLMVHANGSAKDIPRELVRSLRDPRVRVTVEISPLTRLGQP